MTAPSWFHAGGLRQAYFELSHARHIAPLRQSGQWDSSLWCLGSFPGMHMPSRQAVTAAVRNTKEPKDQMVHFIYVKQGSSRSSAKAKILARGLQEAREHNLHGRVGG
jgi:hypothetical protein